MLTITMRRALDNGACEWEERLARWQEQGPLPGEDEPLDLRQVISRLDLSAADAVWCLRICEPAEGARRIGAEVARRAALRALDHAERVLPIWEEAFPRDGRPRAAVEAGRARLEGRGGVEAAEAAAEAAAGAAGAAWATAWAARSAGAAWAAGAAGAAWAATWAAWAARAVRATAEAAWAATDAARATAWAAAGTGAEERERALQLQDLLGLLESATTTETP